MAASTGLTFGLLCGWTLSLIWKWFVEYTVIVVNNLTKFYGLHSAVEDVTFTVNRGEVFGLLGPNGAGKSTIMKMVASFMPPTSGSVKIMDYDTVKDSLDARKCIGYLPGNTPLYSDMTVESFLRFAAQAKGVKKEQISSEVRGTVSDLGLSEVRERKIDTLPKGYRQRVGLAQALIGDPPVLVFDDPTGGLDARQSREIEGLIKDLSGWKTMLIASHNPSKISGLCDRVAFIDKGRVASLGTPRDLTEKYREHVSIKIIVGDKAKEALKTICRVEGVLSILILNSSMLKVDTVGETDLRPVLADRLVNAGIPLLEIARDEKGLEDVFMDITGRKVH